MTATLIKAQLAALAERAEAAHKAGDNATADALLTAAEQLATEYKTAKREEAIRSIGRDVFDRNQTTDAGPTTFAALKAAGFDRSTKPSVTIDQRHVTGLELKAGSVDGGIDGTEIMDVFVAPVLGVDGRYLYPRMRAQGVTSDETGVTSYRQKSRSLASPTDMIRAIDATGTKPETDTAAEVVQEPLKQIATVSTGTPNVLLESGSFRSWVNNDLTTAYRQALDYHIVSQINAAGIGTGGGGANAFEDILYAQGRSCVRLAIRPTSSSCRRVMRWTSSCCS